MPRCHHAHVDMSTKDNVNQLYDYPGITNISIMILDDRSETNFVFFSDRTCSGASVDSVRWPIAMTRLPSQPSRCDSRSKLIPCERKRASHNGGGRRAQLLESSRARWCSQTRSTGESTPTQTVTQPRSMVHWSATGTATWSLVYDLWSFTGTGRAAGGLLLMVIGETVLYVANDVTH